MKIVHLSYSTVKPQFNDPKKWLKKITHTTGVMESMTAYGEVIGIFHIQYRGDRMENGVKYYFTNMSKWQLWFPIRFNFFIRALDPDVIILHGLIFPWQILMLLMVLKRKPIVIAQHHAERPFRDFRKFFQRKLDRSISAYLFSGLELGKMWVDANQIAELSKIRIVMGTSSPFYKIDQDEARAHVPVRGEFNYLWVGDLTKNKDPLCAVTAFKSFLELHPKANLWMIYGSNYLEHELKSFIEKHRLHSSVHLVARVEHGQLLNWYNSLDFLISCSHYEGSGIAVCESMSCGCIPIVTGIPSFKMMTKNGDVGFLFDPGKSEQLLECLIKSLDINVKNEKSKVLSLFEKELSFDANARKIMEIVKEASE